MNGQYGDDGHPAYHGEDERETVRQDALPGPLLRQCEPPYRRSGGHVALVRMYGNGGYSVQRPDRPREDHDRPLLRQAVSAYEVALGRHVTRFGMHLPAAGDVEFFRADVTVTWEVEHPVLVVQRQVKNVAELTRGDLVDRLRRVSRRFRLTDAQAAEEMLQSELDSERFALGADLGLSIKINVHIDLSERVGKRISDGGDLELQLALSDKEHALNRRKEQQQSELVRERARHFEALLSRGDAGRIAYFMAKDPGKALEIEQHFAQQRRRDEADQVAFLNRLIDAGLIERHDIHEGVYEALQYLRQTGRSVGRTVGTALPGPPRHGEEPDSGQVSSPASGRRRPFWETSGSDGAPELATTEPETPELEAAPGESASREPRDASRAADPWDAPDAPGEPYGVPGVREPSSVESAGERAERTRDDGDFASWPRGGGRASDRFDDWED